MDSIGVGESEVTTSGDRQIIVSVPNVQQDELVRMVGQTAQLAFRLVYAQEAVTTTPATTQPTTEPSSSAAPAPTAEPSTTAAPTATASPSVNKRPLPGLPTPVPSPRPTAPGAVPLTTEQVLAWKPSERDQSDFANYQCGDSFPDVADQPLITCDEGHTIKYLLSPAAIYGSALTTAAAGIPQGQVSWIVTLEFNSTGANAFETVTKEIATRTAPQNQFAIVLDGNVISRPLGQLPDPGWAGQIPVASPRRVSDLGQRAEVRRPAADVRRVSVDKCRQARRRQLAAGIIAGLIGSALVVAYCFLYYRALSIVVSAAGGRLRHHIRVVVLLGQAMGFALTSRHGRPDRAIGITADSFIIYFERIRDEVREGRRCDGDRERLDPVAADDPDRGRLGLAAVRRRAVRPGGRRRRGFAFTLGLTTVIDIAVVFLFTKPLVSLLGQTKYFGEGGRVLGLRSRAHGCHEATGAAPATSGTREAGIRPAVVPYRGGRTVDAGEEAR